MLRRVAQRACLFAWFMGLPVVAAALTIELTQQDLQQRIDARMPFETTRLLATVRVSDAKVLLPEGSERIGLKAAIGVDLAGFTGRGRGYIEGKLDYDSGRGEFYLRDPEVKALTIDHLPSQYQPQAREMVGVAVREALDRFPIYRLDAADGRQRLAKALLQSVRVEGGLVVLELGP